MIETKKFCYCDILSEHNNQKVNGATTYKDIIVMKTADDGETVYMTKMSIDMCPACYAKYRSNLFVNYDLRGRTNFVFQNQQTAG